MKLLPKNQYSIVEEHLSKVNFNKLFAKSVVKQCVNGLIYVNDIDNPSTFYILHPYGMSLLFGKTNNHSFNNAFIDYALNSNKVRNNFEWLQVFPVEWNAVFERIFKERLFQVNKSNNESKSIEIHTRVNFNFNINKYQSCIQNGIPNDIQLKRTDKNAFNAMQGTVIPQKFWNNVNDFINNSIGFSLFYKNELAATAYAAFIHNNQLEIGIETIENYRGKGFAQIVCSKIIDYCIENNLEPIWSCRKENTGSYWLAQKLGFKPIIEMPFYKLPY